MATTHPTVNPDDNTDNTDSDNPQKISEELLEDTVDPNTNHKDTYIGDFVECIDYSEKDKKIYYPYDLFIHGLDEIELYIPNYSYRDPRYAGKKVVLPKLSYGDKNIVRLHGKVGEDLSLYFHKNGVGGKVYLTKYSGELDRTLDDDGKEVYTLKNYKKKYIGDFVECTDFPSEKKKIYYPYDLFIDALDDIRLFRFSSSSSDIYNLYVGKDEVLPKLSYGVKEKVILVGDKDLTSYFNKNGVGGTMHLTKYSGELDITLDDDGKEVYTLKKIHSFIKRICDKIGKCFRSSKKPPEGGSKKRAKKTRKQRKHRNLKRNHKK